MAGKTAGSRSAEAWALAGRQQGLVTRAQLLALGFSPRAIEHRLATGRLHRLGQGVYAVGWARMTPMRRWMAAVLECGPRAVVSHRSAAALWRIGKEGRRQIDISVCGSHAPRRPGIAARARPSLSAEEICVLDGVPVTTPICTLVDIAAEIGPRALERAVNEADKRDLVDPETLRAALHGYAGVPGVRSLRRLLDRDTFRLSDRELEVLFRPIAQAAGLPTPQTKLFVNGFEVDFFWPQLGLVVETDGFRYHRTATTQSRDALRDQTHTAGGLTPLRFSHHQVKYEPARVLRVLAATARRLSG